MIKGSLRCKITFGDEPDAILIRLLKPLRCVQRTGPGMPKYKSAPLPDLQAASPMQLDRQKVAHTRCRCKYLGKLDLYSVSRFRRRLMQETEPTSSLCEMIAYSFQSKLKFFRHRLVTARLPQIHQRSSRFFCIRPPNWTYRRSV
jgi:hypothetical protein